MREVIQEDHMPVNNGTLKLLGLPDITFITISELTLETTKVTLPDGTAVSGGKRNPWELTVTVPSHHAVQILAMDAWVEEGKNAVNGYKKAGSLIYESVSGNKFKTYTVLGVWAQTATLPAKDMDNDGDQCAHTYVLSGDDALPA